MKRRGMKAGQLELTDVSFSTPTEEHPVSEPVSEVRTVNLSKEIKALGKSKNVAGASTTSKVSLLLPETAEYLYLTNGYVFRGVEQTITAILRNGYEITAANKKDQQVCDNFRMVNELDTKLLEIARNTAVYGNAYIELFDSEYGPMIEELPPAEIDFQRDTSNNIVYDKDGMPKGYVQKRQNKELAKWDADLIGHFTFIKLGGSDTGISLLQSTIFPCTEFGLIRANLADSFIRSLNVVHIAIEGANQEILEDVSNELSKQFTAESAYVTSERYKMSNLSNVGNNVNPAEFIEPAISEIASAFSIPVELISSTSTFRLDDFPTRYSEWLETIKTKQRLIAEVLETQVFARILEEPVTVKFNDPNPTDVTTLMKHLGFAVQSNAITEDQSQKILQKLDIFPEV